MNKRDKNNQNGFTVVEILLMLVILCIVGLAGYYVYSRQSNSAQPSIYVAETTTDKTSSAAPAEVSSSDRNYVYVPDWKVKIGLGEYSEKVKVSSASQFENTSTVQITILPDFSEYADCETYVAFSRTEPPLSLQVAAANAIDSNSGYTYYDSAVSECGSATPRGKAKTVSIRDLLSAFNKYGIKE